MKWIFLIGLWSCASNAQWPMVFMRESATEKTVVMKHVDGSEVKLGTPGRWHLYPDITSDGTRLAWVEGASERSLELALHDVVSNTRSTFKPELEGMTLHPRFSRNGKLLAFSMPTAQGNKIALVAPEAMKKTQPRVLTHEGVGYFPRPSSDGAFVVFQRNLTGKKEVVEMETASGKIRVLAEGMAPSLSADESLVAYTSKANGSWDVWTIDRRTLEKSVLTQDPADEMAPAFMPDGNLAFASNKSGRFQLYKIAGGQWSALSENPDSEYAPNFAGETALKQSALPSFPAPLRSSLGAIQHQGKIYLCGGHAGSEHTYPPESFTDNLQVYDPATGWKELAPRPRKAHGFQLAAHGNYLYAFGGFAYQAGTRPAWRSLDEIDRYDIAKNEWTTVGVMPRRRSSNVAVTVDGKVYLIGGWDATPKAPGDFEGTFHHAVDVFDLEKETIVEAPWKIPPPLRRAFTAVQRDGDIILVGGLGVGSTHFELLANITRIDPRTGFARELSTMPFATFAPAAGILGDDLMVFGGMFKTGPMDYEYVSHVYALDLDTLAWRHTGRSLVETKGFSQVVPFAGGLAVIGGHRYYADRDEPVSTVETFNK